jgi:hypothetical protein
MLAYLGIFQPKPKYFRSFVIFLDMPNEQKKPSHANVPLTCSDGRWPSPYGVVSAIREDVVQLMLSLLLAGFNLILSK